MKKSTFERVDRMDIKIVSFIGTTIFLLICAYLAFICAPLVMAHSSLTHSIYQSIATCIGFFIGAAGLYRYYMIDNKNAMLFYIGVGFIATSIIDGYHTIVTSQSFIEMFPNVPSNVARWSWVSTRIFLSILFVLALVSIIKGGDKKVNEKLVYTIVSILTISTIIFFFTVPLPFPISTGSIISRSAELIPGCIFLIALIGFLALGRWKTDKLEYWIVLALITSVISEFFFMGESRHLFDLEYLGAHIVKLMSYLMVYIGITEETPQKKQ